MFFLSKSRRREMLRLRESAACPGHWHWCLHRDKYLENHPAKGANRYPTPELPSVGRTVWKLCRTCSHLCASEGLALSGGKAMKSSGLSSEIHLVGVGICWFNPGACSGLILEMDKIGLVPTPNHVAQVLRCCPGKRWGVQE